MKIVYVVWWMKKLTQQLLYIIVKGHLEKNKYNNRKKSVIIFISNEMYWALYIIE